MKIFKKTLILSALTLAFLQVSVVFASGKCPSAPYPISNTFSRNVQKTVGLNFLAKTIVQNQIKKELQKSIKGNLDVELNLYSFGDLVAGKFKNIKISGENLQTEGIYISSLESNSLCNFTHIDYKKNPIVPISDIFAKFNAALSEADLNKTVNSPQYASMLKDLKFNHIIDLAILNPKIKINNDKIYLSGNINFSGMPGMFSVPVKLGAKIVPDKSRLRVVELDISSMQLIDLRFMNNFVKKFKPVIFDFNKLFNNGESIYIQELIFKDNIVKINGTYYLPAQKVKK